LLVIISVVILYCAIKSISRLKERLNIILLIKAKRIMIRKILSVLTIFLASVALLNAQTGSAVGIIVDSDGLPLIGANVVVKGTTTGTITDIDGNYKLTGIPVGQQILLASFIGYANQESAVSVSEGQELKVNFTLIEDITTLDELVVIGYGVQKKEDKTGAVAQIKADELIGGAVTDPLQAIAGKAAGVVVTKGGGNPTDDAKIKIRGSAGIGNSDDGGTNTNPLYVIDGVPGADPNMVAPTDIESFNILKDAASTAIYGSQGANGVIIITTKSGKSGEGRISFNSTTSIDNIANAVDLLSASEYKDMVTKYGLDDSFIDGGAVTDWQDEIFRTSISQQYNLSASGGNEKNSYYGSITYQDNQGIIEESSRQRTIGNLNITHKGLNDKLLIRGGINATFEESNLVELGSNSRDDILYQTYRRNPTDSAYLSDGSISYEVIDASRGFDYVNPLGVLKDETRVDVRKKVLGNVSAQYEIIDGLKFKLATSYLSSDKEYTFFRPAGILAGQGNDTGEGQRNYEIDKQKTIEATMNYLKSISDLHNLSILGGYSWQENSHSKFGVIARQSQSASVGTDDMESFLNIIYGDATSEADMSRLIGFFGRVAYNFDNKYYVGASIRADGSSKFGENNKWGYFPTTSLGWNVHRESFLGNVYWLNQLKLRASYGVSGNQSFDPYNSRTVLKPGIIVVDPISGNNVLTWSADQNHNPDLKWEQTSEINLGIDYGLLDSRISGSLELYSKKTVDMLNEYSVPSPPNVYSSTWANSGSMTNKGVEFFVTAHVVNNTNVSWKTTVGFSKNLSKVTDLGEYWSEDDSKQGYISGQGIVGSDNWTMFVDSGQPIGNFYLYEYLGVNARGDAVYANRFKEDEAESDSVVASGLDINDRYIAGNATPKVELSWSNSLTIYKNWTVDFTLRGLFGQQVYNHTNAYFSSPIFFPYANVTADAKKYMDDGFFGQFTVPSDEFMEDASFVRLDYLSLGYTFNLKNNEYIKSLKLSAMANNLFVITDYSGADPEMTIDGLGYGVDSFGVYPKSRTFSFGVNATF
jgi:TonB-linked SusC/RagA family outer membrane protein